MTHKSNYHFQKVIFCFVLFVILCLTGDPGFLFPAVTGSREPDPLFNWNNGPIKKDLLAFVQTVCDAKGENFVPTEDRIAVLDMDGTIICESPLWMEVNAAQEYLWAKAVKNPALLSNDIYKYAYDYHVDPHNPATLQTLKDNCVAVMTGAFVDWDQEDYIRYVYEFSKKAQNPDYKVFLQQTFYAPMIQLIYYLLEKEFRVYIVSGSEQGLMWGVCTGTLPLPRENLVGTLIELTPKYKDLQHETQFIRGGSYLSPRNLKSGKPEHIYYQIGKKPILAFGNTADDFDMFLYTYSNKYYHRAFLVDHDDKDREYEYPDKNTKEIWGNAVKLNNWNLVSMKSDFKNMFVVK
ncbi:MAG TPA: hypothetical protein VK469_25045 [Candidatus Kapabacteria bacterium]|nr:hypothetical protein [Candidatus Kapabacteria bacterium]